MKYRSEKAVPEIILLKCLISIDKLQNCNIDTGRQIRSGVKLACLAIHMEWKKLRRMKNHFTGR